VNAGEPLTVKYLPLRSTPEASLSWVINATTKELLLETDERIRMGLNGWHKRNHSTEIMQNFFKGDLHFTYVIPEDEQSVYKCNAYNEFFNATATTPSSFLQVPDGDDLIPLSSLLLSTDFLHSESYHHTPCCYGKRE
jgi:hypothetical protein